MYRRRFKPISGYHDVWRMLSAVAQRSARGAARTRRASFSANRGAAAAAMIHRRNVARTQTNRRRRRVFKRVRSGAHTTSSGFRRKKRFPRALRGPLKMVGAKNDYENGAFQANALTGYQAIACKTLLDGNELYRYATKYGSPPSNMGTSMTQKIWLGKVKAKYEISNFTNSIVRFEIYDVLPRHDMSAYGGNTVTPLVTWAKGMSDEGTNDTADFHQSPFKSVDFVKNFVVRKVTRVALDPGASHIHYVNLWINRFIDLYRLVQLGQAQSGQDAAVQLKGFTQHVLIVGNGVPCKVIEGGAITSTAVEFGCVWSVETSIRAVAPNNTENSAIDTLSHVTAGLVSLVNDETGNVEDEEIV